MTLAPDHVDYPHSPGQLYDCAGCERRCFCEDGFDCVRCAIYTATGDVDTMITHIVGFATDEAARRYVRSLTYAERMVLADQLYIETADFPGIALISEIVSEARA